MPSIRLEVSFKPFSFSVHESRRLIVTADDFGLSASVNQAVVKAHREGILTCASLMVNEPGFEEAVSLARENPRLGVGLHLTLLDGHSALRSREIPGLVNEHGQFTQSPVMAGLRYFVRRRRLQPQLRAEIKAQFKKFQSTGLSLDHVNSHHHLHAHPVVFDALMAVAAETGLSRLRLPLEPALVGHQMPRTVTWRDRLHLAFHCRMASRCRPILRKAGIQHNDWMFGLTRTGRMDEAYLKFLIPLLPSGVSEVYAHPAVDECQHELGALTRPAVQEMIKSEKIALIRFAEL